jgi:hypothetical protein
VTVRCARCHETKAASEFPAQPRKRNGLSSYCRACANTLVRRWREANREAVNQSRREAYASSRETLGRDCVVCGASFTPKRRDARTCSRVCRSRLSQIARTERERARRANQGRGALHDNERTMRC